MEQMGIHYRKAYRYMNIAKRFGKFDSLSNLPPEKLYVMDMLTDPELERNEDIGKPVLSISSMCRFLKRQHKESILKKTPSSSTSLKRIATALERIAFFLEK